MNELSLASLLRGFEIGDEVIYHFDASKRKARRVHGTSRGLYDEVLTSSLDGQRCLVYKVNYEPPGSAPIQVRFTTETMWAFEDELTHYYEEQND